MSKKLSPRVLLDVACQCLGRTAEELIGRDRRQAIAEDRQIAMFVIREYSRGRWQDKIPFTQIARLFDRDHTTVMYAYKTAEDRYSVDKHYQRKLNKVIKEFLIIKEVYETDSLPRDEQAYKSMEYLRSKGYIVYPVKYMENKLKDKLVDTVRV